jgi:hypothetical protein
MADGAAPAPIARDAPQGRIPREKADAMVMACLVCLASGLHDDTDREVALQLLPRALHLASRSTRMARFRPLADAVLAAAPARRTRDGAVAWLRANMDLSVALARDAAARAVEMVEV